MKNSPSFSLAWNCLCFCIFSLTQTCEVIHAWRQHTTTIACFRGSLWSVRSSGESVGDTGDVPGWPCAAWLVYAARDTRTWRESLATQEGGRHPLTWTDISRTRPVASRLSTHDRSVWSRFIVYYDITTWLLAWKCFCAGNMALIQTWGTYMCGYIVIGSW